MHIPFWLILTQTIFDLASVVTIWYLLLWQRAFSNRLHDIDERLDDYNSARSRVVIIPAQKPNNQ
jgi:hypothetical protein